MENGKLVSAIITTHERQELLVRAVESVFNQTYKNLELIVVDDASEERADKLLKGFDLNYIYIPKEESKGGNHARNLGVLAAKGEYVAFLDDDDYWLPTKIQEQVELIEEKGCGLVYCPKTHEVIENGNTNFFNGSAVPSNCGDMSRKILYTICTTTSCILVKKSLLNEVGLFNENLKFWQEYELTIRLAQKTPFYYVWKSLVVYRINTADPKRLTNKFFEWKNAVKQIHSLHSDLYKKLNFKEKLLVKHLVFRDAKLRSSNANLRFHNIYYVILLKLLNLILRFC